MRISSQDPKSPGPNRQPVSRMEAGWNLRLQPQPVQQRSPSRPKVDGEPGKDARGASVRPLGPGTGDDPEVEPTYGKIGQKMRSAGRTPECRARFDALDRYPRAEVSATARVRTATIRIVPARDLGAIATRIFT